MNCTLCHLSPSRLGSDRCGRCTGIHLIRLSGEAHKALAAIMARPASAGWTVDQAVSSCLVMHNDTEAGAAAARHALVRQSEEGGY
jgi:hypothetical protein